MISSPTLPQRGKRRIVPANNQNIAFLPPENQDSSIGFDWMRPVYQSLTGTPVFPELGRSFPPGRLQGRPYFGPWLAL